MKTRFAALLCILTANACGSSDHPAQDPSGMATTPIVSDSNAARASTSTATSTKTSAAARTSGTSADVAGAAPAPATNVPGSAGNAAPVNRASSYAVDETGATKGDGGIANLQAAADVSPGAASHQGGSARSTEADNSGINERDRHATLTPMDQGGKEGERQITAAIRRGVVADKSLSFVAKNVKIVTIGSRVTLRGTVKTEQERATIEALARQTAGVTDVDDQIDVKTK